MRASSPTKPPTSPSYSKAAKRHGALRQLLQLARRPLEQFLRIEAASGIVLLVATAVALTWSNSPLRASYAALWHTPLELHLVGFSVARSLEWLVNDGLMVIFFFVVGMEIRRELHHGELADWRRATLPAVAAIGGMVMPAALYLCLAGASATTRVGWGVPMATDIAFAVGILTLLGKRVPASLRVLLLALAVIDDLGAIVVIALFYSSGVAMSGLLVAALGVAAIVVMQRLGVRSKLAYVLPALVVWAGVYAGGIHPTIAGVIVGLMTPVQSATERGAATESIVESGAPSPAESLIEMLHPWVAFGIMPVFALANAGVTLTGVHLDAAATRTLTAVVAGLVIGKPIGIWLACWLTLALRIAALPVGITARHLIVLGAVAGVGFTMALFVAQLAFGSGPLLGAAKLGVLIGSAIAAGVGVAAGRGLLAVARDERQ